MSSLVHEDTSTEVVILPIPRLELVHCDKIHPHFNEVHYALTHYSHVNWLYNMKWLHNDIT